MCCFRLNLESLDELRELCSELRSALLVSSAACAKSPERFPADSVKLIATLGQDLAAYTRRDAETAAITVRLRSHGGEC